MVFDTSSVTFIYPNVTTKKFSVRASKFMITFTDVDTGEEFTMISNELGSLDHTVAEGFAYIPGAAPPDSID